MVKQKRETAREYKTTENKQRRGIVLEYPLTHRYTRNIGVEIGEKVVARLKLDQQIRELIKLKREGEKVVNHWTKEKRIERQPIRYKKNGNNRVIFYEASIEESQEKFNANYERIFKWLEENGYEPTKCKRRGTFELETKGVACDI